MDIIRYGKKFFNRLPDGLLLHVCRSKHGESRALHIEEVERDVGRFEMLRRKLLGHCRGSRVVTINEHGVTILKKIPKGLARDVDRFLNNYNQTTKSSLSIRSKST